MEGAKNSGEGDKKGTHTSWVAYIPCRRPQWAATRPLPEPTFPLIHSAVVAVFAVVIAVDGFEVAAKVKINYKLINN